VSVSLRIVPNLTLRLESTEDITFAYETSVSLLPPPKDTGTVGVIDGCTCMISPMLCNIDTIQYLAMILLTPFRVQNVPPPMSSYQISLTTIPDILQPPPAHISFSPNSDALGTVSISNEIQLWNLKTRLGGPQGTGKERAKVADPELVWNGRAENIVNAMARQIVVWSGNELLWNLAILGRGNDVENDIIEIIQVEGATVSRRAEISLGSSGTGKMIALSGLEAGIAWESNDGRIFSGMSFPYATS
jgi:elongator complex protein 1